MSIRAVELFAGTGGLVLSFGKAGNPPLTMVEFHTQAYDTTSVTRSRTADTCQGQDALPEQYPVKQETGSIPAVFHERQGSRINGCLGYVPGSGLHGA
jgi:hypothetical protein